MKQIPLTQGKFAIVDDDDYDALSKFKWLLHAGRYASRGIEIKGHHKTIFMHRQILTVPDGFEVDHINQNKLDNRKENLRICTRQQNMYNRGTTMQNSSGYKGVSWNKRDNNWVAQIRVNGQQTFLGYYSDIKEAAKAYDNMAILLHGEFIKLNISDVSEIKGG